MQNRITWFLVAAMGLAAGCGTDEDVAGDTETPAEASEIDSFESALTSTLIYELFSESGSLVTNEYATHNPTHTDIVTSPLWRVTSGSLYRQDGTGWSGKPDDISPNALSTNGNRSAIFRMVSKRTDIKNASVKLKLRTNGFVSTPTTPTSSYDGVHVFLRYASEEQLYAITVNRKDGHVVFKKKVPGGATNGGTYYELAPYKTRSTPIGTWQTIEARAKNLTTGVRLELYINGSLFMSATDTGAVGGAPLTAAGRIGFRGDNTNFNLDSISVTAI